MASEHNVFSLINEPWIPMRRRSGTEQWVAPEQVTDALETDPFVAFAWPRADFNAASFEWMIGLLCTAFMPSDEGEWRNIWEAPPTPEILARSFAQVAGRFYLFSGSGGFMQDPELAAEEGLKHRTAQQLLREAPAEEHDQEERRHLRP